MIKKDKRVNAAGQTRTQIRVVESYRPGNGSSPRQRTIKDFGCMEDQKDPDAFMALVEEYNSNYKQTNPNVPLSIDASREIKMYCEENRRQNYGYRYIEAVYDALGIDSFIDGAMKAREFRGGYSPAEIFKYLVLLRILSPDSKRSTCQMKNGLYGKEMSFTLQEVYRSLDCFAGFETALQIHLNDRIKATVGRDLSHAFYDVTNYYFEIDFPDGEDDLRKRGVSKEHRVDPIVAMGLFIDSNGLPVSMSVYPGNTSDSLTLQPAIKEIRASYGLGRLVAVADKGLNSSKNIDALVNAGDGFVFSQVLRGKKGQRYHGQIFETQGWAENRDGTYRYKQFEEEYTGHDAQGGKVTRKRRVLLYWNKAEADIARRKRDEKLEKAARSVKNNAYAIKKGVDEYTKENVVDSQTGEYLENPKKVRSVDFEKAEKDALLDGFFCIVTSELDYDERKIRQVYGSLWRIEQSFRIMKSDLYARPVFVSKNEHIRAHFLICFVALLIVRIMQHLMGESALSAERIARALNAATCRVFRGGIVHLDDIGGAIAFKKTTSRHGERVDTLEYSADDEIALDFRVISGLFGAVCDNVFIRREVFNRLLGNITLALQ